MGAYRLLTGNLGGSLGEGNNSTNIWHTRNGKLEQGVNQSLSDLTTILKEESLAPSLVKLGQLTSETVDIESSQVSKIKLNRDSPANLCSQILYIFAIEPLEQGTWIKPGYTFSWQKLTWIKRETVELIFCRGHLQVLIRSH